MDNKPKFQGRWGGWRWAIAFYSWEWKQILYVTLETSCSTLPGHLQVQGVSGRLRPHSRCLAIDTSGPGLPVAQRSTSEISLSLSGAPLEGWIIYWASFRFNFLFKVASIHINVKPWTGRFNSSQCVSLMLLFPSLSLPPFYFLSRNQWEKISLGKD